MFIQPVVPAAETITLPAAHAVSPVAQLARATPETPVAKGNLSQVAAPVYEALQSAAALPPSPNPTFIPPATGNALRLYAAVQALAAERVYPAPVFSFRA